MPIAGPFVILTFNLSRSSKVKPMGPTSYFLPFLTYFTSKYDLDFDPEGHPRSDLTVPIDSAWLLSQKSSLGSNLVFVTLFKIFRIKGL